MAPKLLDAPPQRRDVTPFGTPGRCLRARGARVLGQPVAGHENDRQATLEGSLPSFCTGEPTMASFLYPSIRRELSSCHI
jgi:hypothetical protein